MQQSSGVGKTGNLAMERLTSPARSCRTRKGARDVSWRVTQELCQHKEKAVLHGLLSILLPTPSQPFSPTTALQLDRRVLSISLLSHPTTLSSGVIPPSVISPPPVEPRCVSPRWFSLQQEGICDPLNMSTDLRAAGGGQSQTYSSRKWEEMQSHPLRSSPGAHTIRLSFSAPHQHLDTPFLSVHGGRGSQTSSS